jgi:hypothetical protein
MSLLLRATDVLVRASATRMAVLLLCTWSVACGGSAMENQHPLDAAVDDAAGGNRDSGGATGVGGTSGSGGVHGGGGPLDAGRASDVEVVDDAVLADASVGGDDGVVATDASVDVSDGHDSADDSAGLGAACGAATDPPCGDWTYCEWPDNRCGASSHGACVATPKAVLCIISTAPVCGCDGQIYAGVCEAAKAGVDVSSNANCAAPTNMFRCGWSYCRHKEEYCYAQVGGAVTNPGSYVCTPLPAACAGSPSCACVPGASMCTSDAQGDVTATLAVP